MKPKLTAKYEIPDGSDFGPHDDSNLMYEVSGQGDTIIEFLDSITISDIDQDGGDHSCYGFDDAPLRIQNAILRSVDLTWNDVGDAYDHQQQKRREAGE
jgi:hypothetical protein